METIGSESFDLDIGRRIVVIIVFLGLLWFFLNYLVHKVKSGEIKIPEFLTKKLPGLKNLDQSGYSEHYKIKIIQRQVMPDGYELMVMDIDNRHILLSKHINSGVQYITDLN